MSKKRELEPKRYKEMQEEVEHMVQQGIIEAEQKQTILESYTEEKETKSLMEKI